MLFRLLFEIVEVSEVDAISVSAQNCHVAGLVRPFWHLGYHFGTLGATLRGHGNRRKQVSFVQSCYQVLFSRFTLPESGCTELENQAVGVRVAQKTTFLQRTTDKG